MNETHCVPSVTVPSISVTSLVHVPLESISSGQAPTPARHCRNKGNNNIIIWSVQDLDLFH